MERSMIKSYQLLADNYTPEVIHPETHVDIAIKLRKRWKIHSNREDIYCLSLLICIKHVDLIGNKYSTLYMHAALIIATRLLTHSTEIIDLNITDERQTAARELLYTLQGRLYIPTAINFYDTLEGLYHTIPLSSLPLTKILMAYAYAAPTSLLMNPLNMAIAAMVYIQIITYKAVKDLDDYETTTKMIDQFHYLVYNSPLDYTTLPMDLVEGINEYKPEHSEECLVNDPQQKRKVKKIKPRNVKSLPSVSVKVGSKLGSGSFGDVHRAVNETGKTIAYKVQGDINSFTREVVIMSSLKHKNLQSIRGFNTAALSLSIEMTLQPWNLERLITLGKLTDAKRKRYTRQLFEGVAYLHSNGVLHGDLKPANILISANQVIKIADLGGSNCFMNLARTGQYSTEYVSPLYRPYELLTLNHAYYSLEVDIWSCGIILLQLYDREWDAHDAPGVKRRIETQFTGSDRGFDRTVAGLDEPVALVIMQCLDLNPKTRITAIQALALL